MQECLREHLLMVISDDLHFIHFAEDILPDYGFEIDVVSKRQVVAAALVDRQPDVVFLDGGVSAPQDELHLLNRVRQHMLISTTPIVISSGNVLVLRERRDELAQQGCVILEKPFNLSQLLDALQHALKAPR